MTNTSTTTFLSSLETIALGILSGAANSAAPLASIDPAHPVVSAAIDAGQIGAQVAGATGVPVTQIAAISLSLAQVFASMFGPKQLAPPVLPEVTAH
jgi:hypothetical protein